VVFNVGGGELLVIFLVILIVLGPEKLPEAARKIGNVMGEIRRMSAGFQNEVRAAIEEAAAPAKPSPAGPRPSLEPVESSEPPDADQGPTRASDDPAA